SREPARKNRQMQPERRTVAVPTRADVEIVPGDSGASAHPRPAERDKVVRPLTPKMRDERNPAGTGRRKHARGSTEAQDVLRSRGEPEWLGQSWPASRTGHEAHRREAHRHDRNRRDHPQSRSERHLSAQYVGIDREVPPKSGSTSTFFGRPFVDTNRGSAFLFFGVRGPKLGAWKIPLQRDRLRRPMSW